jgi:hypothetical protein
MSIDCNRIVRRVARGLLGWLATEPHSKSYSAMCFNIKCGKHVLRCEMLDSRGRGRPACSLGVGETAEVSPAKAVVIRGMRYACSRVLLRAAAWARCLTGSGLIGQV